MPYCLNDLIVIFDNILSVQTILTVNTEESLLQIHQSFERKSLTKVWLIQYMSLILMVKIALYEKKGKT